MSAGAAWTLCLDFGTAYSKAAAAPADAWSRFDPDEVRPLMIAAHEEGPNAFLLDSAVFVDEDRILLGQAAVLREAELAHRKRLALRSFKTLLSVSDLDRALNTSAPASIDPHRVFPMRDLIVLYLAYLLEAVRGAQAADPALPSKGGVARRYAAPAWRSGDSAGMHGAILRLFAEAEALRAMLGEELLSPEGVPLDVLGDALPKAMEKPRSLSMGLVFEATAAASYTTIGLDQSAAHVIVVDMGAGTTDFAAVARTEDGMFELENARVTLKQAGDFIDRIIANLVLDKNRWAKTTTQQAALWRLLMGRMRDIKESMFADGRATLRHDGRTLSVSLRELERDKDFKTFVKDLERAYMHGLKVVRANAGRSRRDVQAVAVGGGAFAPFIQDLLRRKPPGGLRVEPRPAVPQWAYASEFGGNLAPVFPQLAIAIGGALAPQTVLAAGEEVSRV